MKPLMMLYMFCILSFAAAAQNPQGRWYTGVVKLNSGQQLQGEISYDTSKKPAILKLRQSDRTLLYNAHQLVLFQIYDDLLGQERTFYALPYVPHGASYEVMQFFEMLLVGRQLSVLSQANYYMEKTINEHVRMREPGQFASQDEIDWYKAERSRLPRFTNIVSYETLYLSTPEGPVRPYTGTTKVDNLNADLIRPDKKLLYALMGDSRSQVAQYMKKNKLKVSRRADLLQIIQYYNELQQEQAQQPAHP